MKQLMLLAFSLGMMLHGAITTPTHAWECNGPSFVCEESIKSKKTKTFNKSKDQTKITKRKTKSDNGNTVVASYYHEPQAIACGNGRFNPNAMTAAHKTLPCGTKVKISGRKGSVVVVINDRGPYIKGREIDLSRAAFSAIADLSSGVARVNMEVL